MTPLEIIFLLPSIRFELFSNIVALCDKIQLTFLRLRPILSPIARRKGYNFLTHRESYVPLSLNLPSLFTMMLPTDLKDKIKIKSKQLGFILAGVTTPDPPPHYSTFENWLAQNQHGTMDYLATERSRSRRADPKQSLPECKSILVLATPYNPPLPMGGGIGV